MWDWLWLIEKDALDRMPWKPVLHNTIVLIWVLFAFICFSSFAYLQICWRTVLAYWLSYRLKLAWNEWRAAGMATLCLLNELIQHLPSMACHLLFFCLLKMHACTLELLFVAHVYPFLGRFQNCRSAELLANEFSWQWQGWRANWV